MDNTQGANPAVRNGNGPALAGGDWRSQLQPVARGRIVNKIMETLKKHLPVSVPEALTELQRIAVRFEERIYAAATSQSDYLRKISLKMLSMDSQSNTNTQQNLQNAQAVQDQSTCYLASRGSTSHTDYPGAGVKEELYQMDKTLKDQYLAGLGDLYEISMKLHGDNHVPTQKPKQVHAEGFKLLLERSLHSLQINKRTSFEENIPMYKRQIITILNSEEWKPEQTFQQSAEQAPSTSSSGVRVAHGMLSPERGNVKRLRPSLKDDIHS